MNILLVSADYPGNNGGIARFSEGIAKCAVEAGHAVRVLTSVGRPTPHHSVGIQVVRIPAILDVKVMKMLPLAIVGLWLCVGKRPDRLILMKWNHEGLLGLIAKKLLGIPYVVVAHGAEIVQFRRAIVLGYIMRRIFVGASRVIANSNYTRQLAIDLGVRPGDASVCYPLVGVASDCGSVCTDQIARRYGLEGKRVILTVGRLVARKGHDDVIRALELLPGSYRDVVYVIVGDGERARELLDLSRRAGLESRVVMVGRVGDEELDGLYRLCDLFVLPARQVGPDVEGFGIAFVEAALRGKPAIGGRVGGVTEVIAEGETGELIEPGNVQELAEKITSLLDDHERRQIMGQRAREHALRTWTARVKVDGSIPHWSDSNYDHDRL